MPRRMARLVVCLFLLGCEARFQAAATQVRSRAVDERAEPYFAGPWPDDRRLIDGALSTRRFPRPGSGSLIETVLATGDRVARGWGLTSPIYVPFTGAIDPASLPADPEAARASDASVFLIDADPGSPGYGQRQRIDFKLFADPTLYLPGNVLALRPVPGFPLRAGTRYAVVVTTGLDDAGGAPVGPEESLWDVLQGRRDDPYLAPLLAVLDATGTPRASVAGAFLFTTQPVMDELLKLRDWLELQPDPALEGLFFAGAAANFYRFEGTYRAPNLQHGVVPYATEGGEFVFDAQGAPVPGAFEAMRVSFCVPKGPVPAAGYPVVFYSHGTGGDFRSAVRDVCDDLAQQGLVTVGIDQVFHGPRAMGATGCLGQDIELCFFNPVNVVGGRNNTRQAALDNVTLRKLVARAALPPTVDPEGRQVRFAAQRVGFFGHSQGGLSGAVYAALSPHLAGGVLSGAGAHITTTILVRKDPIDLRALAEGPLMLGIEGKEALELFHPALALVQALGDVADPAAYAGHWIARPEGGPKALYLTSGLLDPYTSPYSAEVMATSGGVPQLLPLAQPSAPFLLSGLAPVSAPVRDDVASESGVKVTAVFRQFKTEGHFAVFDDATARAQWRVFFQTLLRGDGALVPAP